MTLDISIIYIFKLTFPTFGMILTFFNKPILNVIFRGGTYGALGFVPNIFRVINGHLRVIRGHCIRFSISTISNAMIIDPKAQQLLKHFTCLN